MGQNWFWSDPHLGHGNIIDLAGRPHGDVSEMDLDLIEQVNLTVAAGDTLWVLGDVIMGKFAQTIHLISMLNGHKMLVAGNHDKCFAGHKKFERFVDTYLEAGFEQVYTHTAETVVAGTRVLLCHFPYEGDSHDSDRYKDWRPTDRGQWLIHGHVHEKWRKRGRMINVGVDAWAGRPVSETQLAELMRFDQPYDLPPLSWSAS